MTDFAAVLFARAN